MRPRAMPHQFTQSERVRNNDVKWNVYSRSWRYWMNGGCEGGKKASNNAGTERGCVKDCSGASSAESTSSFWSPSDGTETATIGRSTHTHDGLEQG